MRLNGKTIIDEWLFYNHDRPDKNWETLEKQIDTAIATLTAERDALRRHYDASAPEHNLLALLDLYDEERRQAHAERDALRADVKKYEERYGAL